MKVRPRAKDVAWAWENKMDWDNVVRFEEQRVFPLIVYGHLFCLWCSAVHGVIINKACNECHGYGSRREKLEKFEPTCRN